LKTPILRTEFAALIEGKLLALNGNTIPYLEMPDSQIALLLSSDIVSLDRIFIHLATKISHYITVDSTEFLSKIPLRIDGKEVVYILEPRLVNKEIRGELFRTVSSGKLERV
jgi:hypothetical protein